ncbi:MAG: hypothetical protein ACYC2Y_07995 [Armatimonadota bacterium]
MLIYNELGMGDACDKPILTWKVHLLVEKPGRLYVVLPALAVSLLVCYSMFRNPALLAVTLVLFTAALGDYLFPVRYEIRESGACARTLFSRTAIPWAGVRRYYLDDGGIKLSPLAKQGRLEAYRGVYLRFGSRREEVIEAVRRMRDGHERAAQPGGA